MWSSIPYRQLTWRTSRRFQPRNRGDLYPKKDFNVQGASRNYKFAACIEYAEVCAKKDMFNNSKSSYTHSSSSCTLLSKGRHGSHETFHNSITYIHSSSSCHLLPQRTHGSNGTFHVSIIYILVTADYLELTSPPVAFLSSLTVIKASKSNPQLVTRA